jgi:hypothetical protein
LAAADHAPLRPIPEALLNLMTASDKNCCGTSSELESLLKHLDDLAAEIPLE